MGMSLKQAIGDTADWNRALGHIRDDAKNAGDARWESGGYMFFRDKEGSSIQGMTQEGFEYRQLALDLIQEEVDELKEAVRTDNKVEILDGAADVMFTVFGLVAKAGLEKYLHNAFVEVMNSNWTKVVDEPVFDANGKVGKPDSYQRPDIAAVMAKIDQGL